MNYILDYYHEYNLPDLLQMFKNSRTPHRQSTAGMRGKTSVITGATSGVGLAAARELARAGSNLIIIGRNEVKLSEVAGELRSTYSVGVETLRADFSDLEQVRSCAAELIGSGRPLDVLVNSAGLHSTSRIITAQGFELVYCVNHLAGFVLTWLLIPRMFAGGGGRIIQVSSQGHRFGTVHLDDMSWDHHRYSGLRGYGASKTAQLLCTWEFARRLEGSGLTINAMHPGEVKSNIGRNNGRLYNWFKDHILARSLKDPAISGESIHYLAADPEMEGVNGKFFNLTHPEKPAPHALDMRVAALVWEETIRMTGLDHEGMPWSEEPDT